MTPEPNSTEQGLIVIKKELEHLQDKSLKSIWSEIKELNEQNALLLKEVTLLRKTMGEQVAKGVIIGSFVVAIVMVFLARLL